MQNEGDGKDREIVGDQKVRSEEIEFRTDQLIVCPKCGRSNPPDRAGCLYCGTAIEIAADRPDVLKLNLRALESWENGFNIVSIPPAVDVDVAATAKYLRCEPDLIEQIVGAASPLPVARIESEREAEMATKYLSRLGWNLRIISDVSLKVLKPNIRLRSLEFLGGAVQATLFNTGEKQVVGSDGIALIVAGTIVESKTESVQKGKKGDKKVLSETATSSDELLIDFYGADETQGWRILTKGFDFSGLGSEKSMLAVENIQRLLEKLKAFAPGAIFADDYRRVMQPLAMIWDVEKRTDFQGIKKTGVWRSGFSNVVKTSNLEQFSKYSRLQRILL